MIKLFSRWKLNVKLKEKFRSVWNVKKEKKSCCYTGYFTSDNEPGGSENATHNTFLKLT
jgi:hypothetical protein